MNRLSLVRSVLFALCAFGAFAFAQQALEIIPLRHRTVEQVLPALQPLLEPGGTLSGSRGQLFLRASPANAAEIKQALAAIDRPARRLEILCASTKPRTPSVVSWARAAGSAAAARGSM